VRQIRFITKYPNPNEVDVSGVAEEARMSWVDFDSHTDFSRCGSSASVIKIACGARLARREESLLAGILRRLKQPMPGRHRVRY
jgi:hypothetical protein